MTVLYSVLRTSFAVYLELMEYLFNNCISNQFDYVCFRSSHFIAVVCLIQAQKIKIKKLHMKRALMFNSETLSTD